MDLDPVFRGRRPVIDSSNRWDVRVVAASTDNHMTITDVLIVGRIVACERPGKPLQPCVGFTHNSVAKTGVSVWMKVAGDISGGNPDGAKGAEDKVGDVLADTLFFFPRVGSSGMNLRDSKLVGH